MRAHDESRPFGRCFLCKPEGLLQVRNPRVLTVREVRGGKLLVAESLVIGMSLFILWRLGPSNECGCSKLTIAHAASSVAQQDA